MMAKFSVFGQGREPHLIGLAVDGVGSRATDGTGNCAASARVTWRTIIGNIATEILGTLDLER
jgi:hypothetical protein